jgi:cyclopropane-fatty-acyl-phospholipid synthase
MTKGGQESFDLPADSFFFDCLLGSSLFHGCGDWSQVGKLEDAQRARCDRVAESLKFKKGMRILEIGSGLGSLKSICETYGVEVIGMAEMGEGGQFDHIVEMGFFDSMKTPAFLEKAHSLLKEGGSLLLQTTHLPWTEPTLFLAASQVGKALDGLFTPCEWKDLSADYDQTLMAWFYNLDRNWPNLEASYSEAFYRDWKYRLLTIAGALRSKKLQIWQIVFTKNS